MPTDTTPDPRDMQRQPESQAIPGRVRGSERKPADAVDMARRPPLPEVEFPPQAEPHDETAAEAEVERDQTDGLVAGDGALNRR